MEDLRIEISDLKHDLGDNINNHGHETEVDLVLATIRDDNIENGLQSAIRLVFEGVQSPDNLEDRISEIFGYKIGLSLSKAGYSHKGKIARR
jgi:hypothetical protein